MTDPAHPALFESREAHIARIDADILWLIMGHSGGPLDMQLTTDEKAVLTAIRFRRGAANAMPIRELQQRTTLDARAIKQIVRTLRLNFRLPIGSSKHAERGGYFVMIDAADVWVWRKDVLDQVRAEIAGLRAAAGRDAVLEMLGQLHMEAQREEAVDVR